MSKVKQSKWSPMDGKEASELDPKLWQELPQELLERVIAKLPFSSVVAFRSVCKGWCYDMIPRAALHLEASSKSALLHFCSFECSPWFSQVCIAKSESSSSAQLFRSKSFPLARSDEDVHLLICERGLLYFGFTCRETEMIRDIVVCNPLISESRSLGLPTPLQLLYPGARSNRQVYFLAGVIFDSETGDYCLVTAGVDETGQHVSYLYNSPTSAWTNGSPLLPALREVYGVEDLYGLKQQSFYWDENLYWHRQIKRQNWLGIENVLLKFDKKHGMWSLVFNPSVQWDDMFSPFQHDASKGEIMSWHLHSAPILCEHGPLELLSGELFDQNHVKPPQHIHRPCKVAMPPITKLMSQMEQVRKFRQKLIWGTQGTQQLFVGFDYRAFSEQYLIYHVVTGCFGVAVLVQDTNENSFTELPLMPKERFSHLKYFSLYDVWSFSASLTSLP